MLGGWLQRHCDGGSSSTSTRWRRSVNHVHAHAHLSPTDDVPARWRRRTLWTTRTRTTGRESSIRRQPWCRTHEAETRGLQRSWWSSSVQWADRARRALASLRRWSRKTPTTEWRRGCSECRPVSRSSPCRDSAQIVSPGMEKRL